MGNFQAWFDFKKRVKIENDSYWNFWLDQEFLKVARSSLIYDDANLELLIDFLNLENESELIINTLNNYIPIAPNKKYA